jgi:uncharacterized membrane protein YkvA (DUF1232 family)
MAERRRRNNENKGKWSFISEKALHYAENPDAAIELLERAYTKATGLNSGGNMREYLNDDLTTLIRMVKAYYNKEYDQLPRQTLIRLLGAVAYFVFLADYINEILPVVGLIDDLAIVVLVLDSLQKDLEAFRDWEDARQTRTSRTAQNA